MPVKIYRNITSDIALLFLVHIGRGTVTVTDDNFKFDKNGKKLSKRVENIVGKGEIALYEQLLLFPQCFQKACFPGASKGVIVWELVKRPISSPQN